MSALRPLLVVLVAAFVCGAMAGEDKAPVPDAAKLKEAEKLIKDVFKAEYAKTRLEDKAALAQKLSQLADETKDDAAARYAAWNEASALAAQSGDMETALAVLDKMAATFAVDIVPLKKTAFAAMAANTRDPERSRVFASMRTLLDMPGDPGASLVVGRYLCFVKDDWKQGLPLLTKGTDAALKALAETELAQPAVGTEQISVAESWWDLAEKEPAKQQKAAMQGRAKFWYEEALPSLTGLAKVKAEKRIAAANAARAASPSPSGGGVLPRTIALDLGGGVKLELVFIGPGKFSMGSPATEAKRSPDNETQHQVTLTQPFYMAKYPVTQEQFEALMGKNPSTTKGARNPVDMVSWNDAQDFCTKLSKKAAKTVRLPTEAEWEYACRAGSTTTYYFGAGEAGLGEYCWFKDNSEDKPGGDKKAFAGKMTHPVGSKRPNAWGLYDMHGNVCQWCEDWFEKYTEQAVVDPQGPAQGERHVLRGGSCNLPAADCRTAFRIAYPPDRFSGHVGGFGFRVVVAAAAKTP
ncbi:MAG: formylglycine-generating enzyme family protein [Planctomycetota bacterium]|nr:formylglycine-generating enzyme family protein [Planctomycetota bacterium]